MVGATVKLHNLAQMELMETLAKTTALLLGPLGAAGAAARRDIVAITVVRPTHAWLGPTASCVKTVERLRGRLETVAAAATLGMVGATVKQR
jgi:hypothetical protein